jgi:phthalate 4,5-dioxygenase oxygenase subunit
MLKADQNDRLARVANNAPMGRMLRQHYWMPYLRAERLTPGGDPVRVRLLGSDYISFRTGDGQIGFIDQACPHRGVSLALARAEGDGIRCIFHGWKFDATGRLLDVPNENESAERTKNTVRARHYPVREAGALLWVWLGEGSAPRFPDFEFTTLPTSHIYAGYTEVPCNWVQGIEGTLDSAHVGLLHRSWISKLTPTSTRSIMSNQLVLRYEFEHRPYGLRAVAVRPMDDGSEYVRIGDYVLPYYMFIGSSNSAAGERVIFISVPVDDGNTLLFFVRYNFLEAGPLNTGAGFQTDAPIDPDHFATLRGDARNNWGQDRAAMRDGHFSGFTDNIITEDIVVQVSMGAIVDRSKEHLSPSDAAIVQARRLLLDAVQDAEAGKLPLGAQDTVDFRAIRADARILPPGERWQDHYSLAAENRRKAASA